MSEAAKTDATVFVVDDDEAVREAVRWLVEPTGWHVEAFAGARAFLDAYDPARAGCLVLDVRMPEMSGPELQAELVARGITLPIILLSAHGTVPVVVSALRAGAGFHRETVRCAALAGAHPGGGGR